MCNANLKVLVLSTPRRDHPKLIVNSDKQDNEDKERLDELRVALNLQNFDSRHRDVYKHRTLLNSDFPQRTLRLSEPTRLTQASLDREEMFQHWDQTKGPCLLHLSGQNWTGSDSSSTLLWLSPAAILVLDRLAMSKVFLAYYFCQVSYHVRKHEQSCIQNLTCSLVHQLVSHRPELLRSGELLTSLKLTLDPGFAETDEEDVVLDRMKDCLQRILGAFQSDDKVVLVLDRLDKCYCGEEEITAQEILRCLLSIALHARCQVRILIVARSSWLSAKQATRLETWLRKEHNQQPGRHEALCYLHRKHWDQESERERSLSPSVKHDSPAEV